MVEHSNLTKYYKAGMLIPVHEFPHPLMQGYDSITLKLNLELGGTD